MGEAGGQRKAADVSRTTARLQIALDFVNLPRAMNVARLAIAGGADILEAGTPLIKSEGLNAVRALRAEFPSVEIVADMKTLDAGRIETECATKAGANIVVVMGTASEATILECVEAGRNYGARIGVDVLGAADPEAIARKADEWGVEILDVHTGIDEQMRGKDPLDLVRRLRPLTTVEIAVAGGINSETAVDAVEAGADIVIVGGAVIKAQDVTGATKDIKRALATRVRVKTELFKRAGEEDIRQTLAKVSTANLSDAMHRGGDLKDIVPRVVPHRMVGKAVTVRTYPGDFAKPVEAIDVAGEGDVIVVDVGGVGPVVWGECASESAVQRRLSGIVVDGAIRDLEEIERLGFPAFSRLVSPTAGEPKGMGEINVPITVGGLKVEPGDWIVGDRDGVVRIPRRDAAEIANRAMSVLETENRWREEIRAGSTLSQVVDLKKWEKK